MRTARLSLLFAAVFCLFHTTLAEAQGPYRLTRDQEWKLLGLGVGTTVAGILLVEQVEPFTASELAGLDPSDINSFDRSALNSYREDTEGNALNLASFALPFTLLADSRTRSDWKTLGAMWGEVLLLQSGLTALSKGLVERARPYAYDEDAPMDVRSSSRAKLSFFSGHTSATAATCFFVAKVYSDYPFSKTTKTIVWTAASLYPAVVGFYRVDSGHHFRTDVVTGYLVGAAIGFLVPQLHRSTLQQHASISTTVHGGQFLLTLDF